MFEFVFVGARIRSMQPELKLNRVVSRRHMHARRQQISEWEQYCCKECSRGEVLRFRVEYRRTIDERREPQD